MGCSKAPRSLLAVSRACPASQHALCHDGDPGAGARSDSGQDTVAEASRAFELPPSEIKERVAFRLAAPTADVFFHH